MNGLDRLIGVFAPMAALKRAQARAALEVFEPGAKRSYLGANMPRRPLPALRGASPNGHVGMSLMGLREQARHLVRNTPIGPRVLDVLSANIVGTGIRPVSATGNRNLDKRVNALFAEWQARAVISGEVDFYGAQDLLVRSMVESGESLVRFLPQPSNSALPVPLQLRLMEGDQLDEYQHGFNVTRNATLGIEFDADGRRKSYWIRRAHPGDPHVLSDTNSVKVPARDIVHVYRTLRIGQVRGVSWFAPVMLRTSDLDSYLEATLVKARTEACFVGFVTSGDAGMPSKLAAPAETGREALPGQSMMSPGQLTRLDPGEEVQFGQPSASSSFEPYVLHAAMAIAAGTGITYDQLTGDLRQANYSSLRAGKIEFRALVRQFQHLLLIPRLCQPVWERFIEAARLAGKLPERRGQSYPVKWIAPGFEPIDPKKDLEADILAVRSGRMTWDEFVAEWGNDPETQAEELAAINERIDRLGLVLDTDPRRVARAGQAQAPADAPSPSEGNDE